MGVGLGVAVGVGVGDGVAEGVALGVAEGAGLADGVGVGGADGDGVGDGVGPGVADGVGTGLADGDGVGETTAITGMLGCGSGWGLVAIQTPPPVAKAPAPWSADPPAGSVPVKTAPKRAGPD